MKGLRRWSRRLVRLALSVSIRVKIMGIALGLTVLFGVGAMVSLHTTFRRALEEEIEEVALDIAEDAANDGAEHMLTRDVFSLQQLGNNLYQAHRDVRYILFRDAAGQVLSHTFVGEPPAGLLRLLPVPEDRFFRVQVIDTNEGPIHDIAMRVMGGNAGVVQVGVTEQWMQERMRLATAQLTAIWLGVSLLGIVAAFLLTAILTHPLRELTSVTHAVAENRFDRRAPVLANDELGHLASAFNMMLDRLRATRHEVMRKERLRVELLQKLITAQEEERKRVARELHDHTGQSLTGLAVELRAVEENCETEETRQRVAALRSRVSAMVDEIRELALELRPSLLDDLGLVAAIEHHAEQFQQKMGIQVSFQSVGAWDHDLPAEVETTVYRVCQEALTNAARHGAAKHISVLLTRRRDSVVAIVEDDGQGFDVVAALAADDGDRRLGLHGMRERASLVGGTLTLESADGRGTTVHLEVPTASREAETAS